MYFVFCKTVSGTEENEFRTTVVKVYIKDLVQDCSNTIANALELLQSCTKPSIYSRPVGNTHTSMCPTFLVSNDNYHWDVIAGDYIHPANKQYFIAGTNVTC